MFSKGVPPLSFIISAPAGTGKTTLVNLLLEEHPMMRKHVSYTTRKPREGEKQGHDYWFLQENEFFQKQDDFLESITHTSGHYATSKSQLESNRAKGMHTIFVIDVEGALRLMKEIACVTLFLLPPSYKELERRLTSRNTETDEEIKIRLDRAKKELEMLPYYDYYIINDVLEESYTILKSIVQAEEHKTKYLRT
ncbi:MAG: guanylate kinase [Chlamydiota bacterium]